MKGLNTALNYENVIIKILTLKDPIISESCIEIKIKLNLRVKFWVRLNTEQKMLDVKDATENKCFSTESIVQILHHSSLLRVTGWNKFSSTKIIRKELFIVEKYQRSATSL